jgi:RNA polymerase sigma-70 factor, ECF subfamily
MGDAQAMQAFYQENFALMYRFVYSKIGNREEAEDLTSDIFLKAVRGLDTQRSPLSRQKWVFQIARTTLADYWRAHVRKGGSVRSLDELLEAGWEVPAEEQGSEVGSRWAERIQRILLALPQSYRDVLTYRFLLRLSFKETAARMSRSEASVKVLQFRALKRAADLEPCVEEMVGNNLVVSQ